MTITQYDYVRFDCEVRNPRYPYAKYEKRAEFSRPDYVITREDDVLSIEGMEYPFSRVVEAQVYYPTPVPDEATVVAPPKRGRK